MRHPFGVFKIILLSISLFTSVFHSNDPIGVLYALDPFVEIFSCNAYSAIAQFAIILFIGLEGLATIIWIFNNVKISTLIGILVFNVFGLFLSAFSLINSNNISLLFSYYLIVLFFNSLCGIVNGIIIIRNNNYQSNRGSLKKMVLHFLSFAILSALPTITLTKHSIITTLPWKQGKTLKSVFSESDNVGVVDNEGNNYLPRWIDSKETQLWIIVPNLIACNAKKITAVNTFALDAEKKGISVLGLAVGTPSELEEFRHEMQTPFPFYGTQYSFMQRYARSNPTLLVISNGRVINLGSAATLPDLNFQSMD